MVTYYRDINPTSGDTAYESGDVWCNQVTYVRYEFTTGDTWVHKPESSGVLYVNKECSKKMN